MGVALRFAAAANTHYWVLLHRSAAGANNIVVGKIVAGTSTSLGVTAVVYSLPDTVQGVIMGSVLTGRFNGVDMLSVTDTQITGNLRAGLIGYDVAGSVCRGDNFLAENIATRARALIGVGI